MTLTELMEKTMPLFREKKEKKGWRFKFELMIVFPSFPDNIFFNTLRNMRRFI